HKRDVLSDPANAQPVAELSIDQVVVYGPEFAGPDANAGLALNQAEATSAGLQAAKPIVEFYEIELELRPGEDQALLTRLVRTLAKDRALRVNASSKLERALEALSSHVFDGENYAPALQPTMPIAEACRNLWRQQLTQLLLKEAGVRYSHSITYIHEMRGAIRGAGVAVRLFEPYFRTKRIRRFAKILKRTSQHLGAIRDLDVALNRLEKSITEPQVNASGDLALLATHWRAERQHAQQALLAWLDSKAYARFIEKFAQFCQTPGKGAKKFTPAPGKAPTAYQVRHVMPSLLIDHFKRVRCFETVLESAEPIPEETLHLLRKECQYLRYSLEFMRLLPGFQGEPLIKALKKFQDQLDQLQDVAAERTLLKALPAPINANIVEQYASVQEAIVAPLRQNLPTALADFLTLSNRRKLTQAIAHL
ncbi:MAG: CHAD domain-containing protein, partial [Chloroflexi bacterium]|nr:CHAD domain-containing protein [Chloroflexota bacterium]